MDQTEMLNRFYLKNCSVKIRQDNTFVSDVNWIYYPQNLHRVPVPSSPILDETLLSQDRTECSQKLCGLCL